MSFDVSNPVCLADHQAQAMNRMSPQARAFFCGGAADEITLRANRHAWESISLWPRVLRQVAGGSARINLLGRILAWPVLLAPIAHQRWAHPEGETASALAAAAQEAGVVLSMQSNTPLEQVAQAYRGRPEDGLLWFQLYHQADRGATLELVRRAESAGYDALVLTVDAPVQGTRDAERRAQPRLPEGIRAVHIPARRVGQHSTVGHSAVFDGIMHGAPVWDDVCWLKSQTRLPVILKGILHRDDALQARSLQVDALIVSNHGGRTLDSAVTSAYALAHIRAAIGSDVPLIVDGGIRRGTDIFKGLALGASAVLLGRPYIYGLVNDGASGVAHVLRLLRDEFEAAMALCGCKTVSEIDADYLCDAPVCASPRPEHPAFSTARIPA